MKKVINTIDHGVAKFSLGLSFCASIMILIVMIAVCADVIGRKVFNHPITGIMEIIKMSRPVIAFFMVPWATYQFSHVRSTIIYGRLPLKGRIVIDVIAYAMGIIFFVALAYGTWPELLQSIRVGEFEGEGALRIATWPTRILIFISATVTAWQMVRCLIMSIIDPQEEVPIE